MAELDANTLDILARKLKSRANKIRTALKHVSIGNLKQGELAIRLENEDISSFENIQCISLELLIELKAWDKVKHFDRRFNSLIELDKQPTWVKYVTDFPERQKFKKACRVREFHFSKWNNNEDGQFATITVPMNVFVYYKKTIFKNLPTKRSFCVLNKIGTRVLTCKIKSNEVASGKTTRISPSRWDTEGNLIVVFKK